MKKKINSKWLPKNSGFVYSVKLLTFLININKQLNLVGHFTYALNISASTFFSLSELGHLQIYNSMIFII